MPTTLVHGRPRVAPRGEVRRDVVRAAPAPEKPEETPPWKAVALMLVVVVLIAATLISLCFLAAKLATGHAV